jgi:uncharacterized protein (DUF2384 family)
MVAAKAKRAVSLHPDEAQVLSLAIGRVADLWKLTNEGLGEIIGVSPATASRLRAGAWRLERGSKPFELAQYLVRLFRSLDSLTGSDDLAAGSWLRTPNTDLDGRPLDLIRSVRGLSEVSHYVDDFRARV